MKTKAINQLTSALLAMFVIIMFGFSACSTDDDPGDNSNNNPIAETTVTDIDGNVYNTIKIGEQTWMAENLKTTKFNDGTDILFVAADNFPNNMVEHQTPGYCWYDDNISNKTVYGGLYNAWAVNTGKLAPTGWHVPSKVEWIQLINYLGGAKDAGTKLREPGTSHWLSSHLSYTNESGFTALPGGYSTSTLQFKRRNQDGNWWSSTSHIEENLANYNWYLFLTTYNNNADIFDHWCSNYLSVRCVKD